MILVSRCIVPKSLLGLIEKVPLNMLIILQYLMTGSDLKESIIALAMHVR